MLVLKRAVGEHIVIGPDVAVTLTEIRYEGGRPVAKLGITAPRDIEVFRSELLSDGDLKECDLEVQRAITREFEG